MPHFAVLQTIQSTAIEDEGAFLTQKSTPTGGEVALLALQSRVTDIKMQSRIKKTNLPMSQSRIRMRMMIVISSKKLLQIKKIFIIFLQIPY